MAPSKDAFLIVKGGPDDGRTVPLKGTVTLGRQDENDVVVDEAGVSRRHAEIAETDVGFYLTDLSKNGTFVNDGNVEEDVRLLDDGDRIRLGPSEVSLLFRSQSADTVEIDLRP